LAKEIRAKLRFEARRHRDQRRHPVWLRPGSPTPWQTARKKLQPGKAQEKTSVFRTERRKNPKTGAPYP